MSKVVMVNKSEEIDKKYPTTNVKSAKDCKELDEVMKLVRRDYKYKSQKSVESASKIFFTS